MTKMQSIRMRILLLSIVLFGALNYGAMGLGYNLIDGSSIYLNQTSGKNLYLSSIIYIIIACAALYLAFAGFLQSKR